MSSYAMSCCTSVTSNLGSIQKIHMTFITAGSTFSTFKITEVLDYIPTAAEFFQTAGGIAVITLCVLLFILLVALIVVICVYCYRRHRR